MKEPKEIFFEMSEGLQTASRCIEIIEQTQKEAWNEAVEAAVKVVKYNQKTNKDLILKLRK